MGTFWHQLKTVKTCEQPRNWCMFDCETKERQINPERKELTLRLGVAVYRRDGRKNNPPIESWLRFTKASQFWDWILQVAELDRPLWMVGYNASVDWRWINGFNELSERGYNLEPPYIKQPIIIIEHKRDDHRIVLVDAMNWVEGKLETWGERLGAPKMSIDFATCTQKELFAYCENDVVILDKVVSLWRQWVKDHDMGSLGKTKASQAFIAYRHRFMHRPIMVHAHQEATEIERDSYHGGRVECFRVGKFTKGPFYKLDVNSMYPAIMRNEAVPTELVGIARNVSTERVRKGLSKYLMIADCWVKTDEPAYPISHEAGLVYPVGEFRTTLTTPHIRYAIKRGHLVHSNRVVCYEGGIIFKQWVDEMYSLRMKYKREGDKAREEIVKKMLNSLYGKFGQRSEEIKEVPNYCGDDDGTYSVIDADDDTLMRYMVICNRRFNVYRRQESMHSFPAIAAHITAASQCLLWRYARKCGSAHRYYCDTDSLITDETGMHNLSKYIDPSRLGYLKVEEKSKRLEIHTLKDYSTDAGSKRKGVSAKAIEIRPNVFQQEQWEGMIGAISDGRTNQVTIKIITKELLRDYRKGVVGAGGVVSPFVLRERLASVD